MEIENTPYEPLANPLYITNRIPDYAAVMNLGP
jgi:hypothetical protein